jgi:RimJ/RimL family protein N-acetyltransferase
MPYNLNRGGDIEMTNQQVVIRNVRKEDAADVLAYMKQVLTESENLTMEPDEFKLTVEQEEAFLAQTISSKHDIMKVAVIDGNVISTAGFHGTDRRRLTHRVELGISVLKPYQGQGIGRAMMAALINDAKRLGKTTIELEVRADNLGAIHLYESLGFVLEGRKKHRFHVKKGYVDTIVMALYMEEEV